MKFLFSGSPPPMLPNSATVDEACIWLLVIMDRTDRSRTFITSLLHYFLEHGFLTERQMDALRKFTSKMIQRYLDGDLEILGQRPAKEQTLEFGTVVAMRSLSDGRVIE